MMIVSPVGHRPADDGVPQVNGRQFRGADQGGSSKIRRSLVACRSPRGIVAVERRLIGELAAV